MLKKIAYMIIFALLSSSALIASPVALKSDFIIKNTGNSWTAGEFGNEVGNANVDANESVGIHFYLLSRTERISKVKLQGLVTAIDMDNELEDLGDGEAFKKTIATLKIENNTTDGFLVGVNAGGAEALHANSNYVFTSSSNEDGEVSIPYHLNFEYTPANPDQGTQVGSMTDSLPNGTIYGTVKIDENRVYSVIIAKNIMTEPLKGELAIELEVANAEQLKFAGKYKATNRFAFIDL